MKIKVIKNVDIDELDFSVRTWNCLRRGMINTVQDIADNYHNLNRVRNLEQRCYDEIMEKIKPYVEFVDKICITNYDRIKSMSVEDLTKFISNITKVVAVKLGNDYVVNNKQFIQQWLLQEVSENDR